MDTKKFLNELLGCSGTYCAVGIKNGRTVQRFYPTIDALTDAAEALDTQGYDAYFALATFGDAPSRKADNVVSLKSLFLDLDCGADKPYPTQLDAIKALQEFCRTLRLPKPSIIVNSGRGVHVYWVLDRECGRDEWLPVAERLKAACIQEGLQIDPTVTADAARILRVPNTHNYKGDPPLAVQVFRSTGAVHSLASIAAAFPEYLIPVVQVRDYSTEDQQDMQATLGNYTKSFRRLIERTVSGSGCAQIKKAVEQPDELSYPEWLHALSIAKHCEEGNKAVHLISKGYSGYDPVETDKIAASITAPHLCITFEKDNPSACEKCPHRGRIRSPIKLCMMVKEAPPDDVFEDEEDVASRSTPAQPGEFEDVASLPDTEVDPDKVMLTAPVHAKISIPPYPAPYFRGAAGGVFIRSRDKEGNTEEVKVHDTDLYITKRLRDPVMGPCYVFRHHTKQEGVQEFTIPGVKLSGKDSFRTELGMNDVFVLRPDNLMMYTERWVRQVQATHPMVDVKTQFGWTAGERSFVVGDREIFADRIEPNPPSTRTQQFFRVFQKKGTIEGWKEVAEFFNKPDFEEHQYMFGLSFGAPLMAFSPGLSGSIFHLKSSGSGHGKSTGQLGGASVWGHPKSYVLFGKDTAASVWNRTEIWKNMVVYIDELSNYEAKDLSDFAYAVVDGVQRNRMSNSGQNAERMRGEPWATLVGTSANCGFLDKIASEYRAIPQGESQRVLEETARPLPDTLDAVAAGTKLTQMLTEHYGHAGDLYIQYVLQNTSVVKLLVNKMAESIVKGARLSPQNRFFAWQAATTLAGLTIAKNMGLIQWDLANLKQWIIARLVATVSNIKDMNMDMADLIGQYYADNVRGILRIRSSDGSFADDVNNAFVNPDAMPINRWVGRHEFDTCKLYLLPTPFKAWCTKQQLDYSAIRAKLKEEYNSASIKMRLGKGTKISLPLQHVIEISWGDTDIPDTQNEAT
jgi:hypothetical protein